MHMKELRVIPTPAESNAFFTRREIFQKGFGALAALLAGAQFAEGHPIRKHLSHPERFLDAAEKVAGDWSPAVLTVHQNETLTILSTRILPGSDKVQVNRLIDLLLTVETAENQQNFVAAIAAIDAESQKRFDRPFKSVDAVQQEELLNTCSTTKSAKVVNDRDSSRDEDDRAPIPGATLRDHFENLKGWIVGAYYSSEPGLRELGWTDESYFDAPPECMHPEGHS